MRRHCRPRREVGIAAAAGFREAEVGATGDALAAEAVVVVQLVHAAELEGVRPLTQVKSSLKA